MKYPPGREDFLNPLTRRVFFSYATSFIQLCAILFQRSPNHILTVELYFHRLVVIQINHADKSIHTLFCQPTDVIRFSLACFVRARISSSIHRHTPVLPFSVRMLSCNAASFSKGPFSFSMYASRSSTPSAYDSYSLICSTRMASACFSKSSMSTQRTVIELLFPAFPDLPHPAHRILFLSHEPLSRSLNILCNSRRSI